MFTKNIDTTQGLYNGAIGIIKEISEIYIKVEYYNYSIRRNETKSIYRV